MKAISIILFTILILSYVPATSGPRHGSFGPFFFDNMHTRVIGHIYKHHPYRETRVYDKHRTRRAERIRDLTIYRVSYSLVVPRHRHWSRPFFIRIEYPDGRCETVVFNENRRTLAANGLYRFSFNMKAKHRTRIVLTLGYYDHHNRPVVDRDNPFTTRVLVLD